MKFWIQSFLLGVPKIIVGFRDQNGILVRIEEMETEKIPGTVKRRGKASWDGNMCINFAAGFLECKSPRLTPFVHTGRTPQATWIAQISMHNSSVTAPRTNPPFSPQINRNLRRRLAHPPTRKISRHRDLQDGRDRVWRHPLG
jgi:hypothetical protein